MRLTLEERFWSKVKKGLGCWEWMAGREKNGYGMFHEKKFFYESRAHRVAWKLTKGPIPKGLFVCHRCDNRGCVNPDHLFLGTPGDNSRDSKAKGRNVFGSKVGSARLTEERVIELKKILQEGKYDQRQLAKMFGVGQSTISRVNMNQSWRHLLKGPIVCPLEPPTEES